ncbi:unnamed protein product [Darwinula stevensoni]|uniref:Glucose-methanol-choline oxidoreductase N-terminal domain-containing protein n=1 Tax=Darwinula stevensoni TaxID=69355 RepID=A0A7R9AGD2_9CRUS|nr:unnamed protein product [Darwinula stevensoni]CAG0903795.1 unnamed protein product [Darwinula stevensoni]
MKSRVRIRTTTKKFGSGGREKEESNRHSREKTSETVGGGTTGSVIASRLSENPWAKVLLIEAGSDGSKLSLIPPFASFMWWFTKFDYAYSSEPQEDSCLALKEGRCRWFRGRMLGGSSALNGALYVRGNHKDYDNWASLGNPGWSFKDLLPLFKRAENFLIEDIPDGKSGVCK